MRRLPAAFALVALALPSGALLAQDADDEAPPETRVMTIATIKVPIGEDRQKVMEFIDRVWAPQARNNPHVLSYRVGAHYYGADARDVVLVSEYADWDAVEAPCGEPCETWADENLPEEGTPEWDELNDLWQTTMKYFARHSDEIYNVNMDLAKN